MTKDFLPLSNLTDEELLGMVYISNNKDPLVTELAARLEHALGELRVKRRSIDDIVDAVVKGDADGDDS